MATYKVIQDIESEDKLLGPLTLRQFIYAAMVAVMGFAAFKLAAISTFLIFPFILPMAFFGLLAAPFGHDQTSEVWLLAKIGFLLKPRRRIWDQTGMQELVTITAPKQVEEHLTDGLTQSEVKSRLQALANTLDSRGWAVKNVNVNLYTQPSYLSHTDASSDRLVDSTSLPQAVPNYEIVAADDIMDETSNPTAQHLEAMINQSEQTHRRNLVATVQNGPQPAAPPADYWFMNQPAGVPQKPGYAAFDAGPTIQPGAAPVSAPAADAGSEEEKKLLEQIHLENARPNPAYGHMRVLDPTGSSKPSDATHAAKLKAGNQELRNAQAAIARLAGNDDLNVTTIAHEANKAVKPLADDEVIVPLR